MMGRGRGKEYFGIQFIKCILKEKSIRKVLAILFCMYFFKTLNKIHKICNGYGKKNNNNKK